MKRNKKPSQNNPAQDGKNLPVESWLQINLGLQQLAYDAEAIFHRTPAVISAFTTWTLADCLMLYSSQLHNENSIPIRLLCILSPIVLSEMLLYGEPNKELVKLINATYESEPEWASHLKLLAELNAGKFIPFSANDGDLATLLDLVFMLGDLVKSIANYPFITNVVASIVVSIATCYTWLKSQETSTFVINHLPLLAYALINYWRYQQHPPAEILLTDNETDKALTIMLKMLYENQLTASDLLISKICKPNKLCFILKYDKLSRENLFKLLATDLIIARTTEGEKHYLVFGISIDKIKSKEYKNFLEQLLEKSTEVASSLEWGLNHLNPLPPGWLAPLTHEDRYDHLLVEEQYFKDIGHSKINKYVLENGYYKIPLLDKNNRTIAREIKTHFYKSNKIKKLEVVAPAALSNDDTEPKFYGNVVSGKLMTHIYKKTKQKNTIEITSVVAAPAQTRAINWGLPENSPYLNGAHYTLMVVETTQGNRVVNSHIWVAIPTPQVEKFKKYLFLLGDEWNAGSGVKRFEAQDQDIGCYKTHDKSDNRYLLMPSQLGTYASGSSTESRPLLLRLHTEEVFTHRQLERGIPNEKLRIELAEYEQRYDVSKKKL